MTQFYKVLVIYSAASILASAALFAQGTNGRQPLGPPRFAANDNRQPIAPPQAPFAPLTAEQIKYRDEILDYWQQETAKIDRYRCKFRRWEYDPQFGPKDRDIARTYAEGVIKYAQPDKGLFRVEFLGFYTPAAKAGEQAKYLAQQDVEGDHWICDGKSIFIFDSINKQLIEQQLPPDMQGQAIADGPIPFMFGAEKKKILDRYWVRVITPEKAVGEYWLEAWPKERGAGFQVVHIILDQADFLPKAMTVFAPGYHPQQNPARTWFVFEERETNWTEIEKHINIFHREFFEPKTPSGWQKVQKPFGGMTDAPLAQANQEPLPTKKTSFFDETLGKVFGRQ